MEPARMFLAVILVIALNLSLTAGDSTATWEDFRKFSSVWAKRESRVSSGSEVEKPKLFRQLTSVAVDKATSGDEKNTTSGGWIAQCHHLSDDLEKSWNLTVVVAEANWPIVENVAETLYNMLVTCTKTGFASTIKNAECLLENLDGVRKILVPAVKMNFQYVQQAWRLIPELVEGTKECFTF